MSDTRKRQLRKWADENVHEIIMDFYPCYCRVCSAAFAMGEQFTDEELDYMAMYLCDML
jgi:hypothetical protein